MNENKAIEIAGVSIVPGQDIQIHAKVSKLPTRTSIEIPVIVSRSKEPGPTLLLLGGMHGDEINGVEIVRRIIAKGLHRPQRGTVVCVPLLNIYGFLLFSRMVPDGKDINRSFPGSKAGSLASQIAYHLKNEILPVVDCGVDFHTGGARINNYPQIRSQLDIPEAKALAMAFGTRFVLNANLREKSFRREAQNAGKPILVYEGGESLRLRKNAIDEGVNGALRVMKHLDMIDEAPAPSHQTIIIKRSAWIRSRSAGLYHTYVRVGAEIRKGEVVGLVTGPYGDFERQVKSTMNGFVIAVNNIPVINKGDALMHIGMID